MKLVIDEEFKNRLPPADVISSVALRKSLVAGGGPQDTIKVLDGTNIIIDGHRRYAICEELKLPFVIQRLGFENRDEVLRWIDQRAAANRNLGAHQRAELVSRMVAESDKTPAEAVAEIAEDSGITERQVYRLKRHGDAISSLPDSIKNRIERGELQANPADVKKMAAMSVVERMAVSKIVVRNKTDKLKDAIELREKTKQVQKTREENKIRKAAKDVAIEGEPEAEESGSINGIEPKVVAKLIEQTIKKLGELRRSFDTISEILGPSSEMTNNQKRLDGLSSYLEKVKNEIRP